MDVFSTREWAAIIWISVIFSWCAFHGNIRGPLWKLFKAAADRKLVVVWLSGFFWIILGVYLLFFAHIWEINFLKDTIFWTFSAGIVVLFHGILLPNKKTDYRSVIIDLFKLTVLFEVFINIYCFNLIIELILFPILMFIALMEVLSARKDEYRSAHTFIGFLLFLLVMIIFLEAIKGFIENPFELLSIVTIKSLICPIFLTLWLLPLSYFFGLYAAYENFFSMFKHGMNIAQFDIFVKLRIVRFFGFSIEKIQNIPPRMRLAFWNAKSVSEIEDIIEKENATNRSASKVKRLDKKH